MYVHPSRVNNAKLPTLKVPKESSESADAPNRTKYIVGFVIGLLIFVPTLLIAHTHQVTGLNRQLFYDLNNLSNTYKTPALWLTEVLGAGYAIAACILVPLLFKRFRLSWYFLVISAGAGIVMEIAKKVALQPRPVTLLLGHMHERAVETGLNSFPSGHATIATALALVMWIILPKRWRWLSIMWILIAGISRIYLGDHTPVDVIGGFAIGLMSVSFLQLIPENIARRVYLYQDRATLLKSGR
jgi:membrane-associated phospholipid phosphatase